MTDRWDVPTLQEELNRKTLETYEWIVERSSSGDMTDAEVKVALQAVFNVTTGLVARDITQAAEVVEGDATAKSMVTKLFCKDERLIAVCWECGSNEIYTHTGKKTETIPCEDARSALQHFDKICNFLNSKGWTKI